MRLAKETREEDLTDLARADAAVVVASEVVRFKTEQTS